MENVRLTFHGTKESETEKNYLECHKSSGGNDIFIEIGDYKTEESQSIYLSRDTAIILVKHLKKAIGSLENNNVDALSLANIRRNKRIQYLMSKNPKLGTDEFIEMTSLIRLNNPNI